MVHAKAVAAGSVVCILAFVFLERFEGLSRVVFVLDGKVLKVIKRPDKSGAYTVRLDPRGMRPGVHRLVATVTFDPGAGTPKRLLRLSFQRCAKKTIQPRFTG